MPTPKDSNKKRKAETSSEEQKETESFSFHSLLWDIKAQDFAIGGKPEEMPMYVCYRDDKVSDVFKNLIDHGFLSCPVLCKTTEYHGTLDLFDIAHFVVKHFSPKTLTDSTDNYWKLFTESYHWSSLEVSKVLEHPYTKKNPFHPVKKGYSALYVVEQLAREPSLHRVAVLDEKRSMLNFVTQSQVANFVHENIASLGKAKRSKKLSTIRGIHHKVLAVKETDVAYNAYKKMSEHHVSALAVLNDQGELTGCVALRDLKYLGCPSFFVSLQKPVSKFLADLPSKKSDHTPRNVVTVTDGDTLECAIAKLHKHQVHRVFIVQSYESKKPIGVITLKDLLLAIID